MAGIYFGAGGVKKVKNIYFGAGGVKKVKKGWIGVNGVPMCFFSSDIEKHGAITSLSSVRKRAGGGSVGNYFLVMSGYTTKEVKTVETYNTSLTRGTATDLDKQSYECRVANIGSYAISGGGMSGNYASTHRQAYNTSLTATPLTGSKSTGLNVGAKVGTSYAIFAGGGSGSSPVQHVDAYNSSLTLTNMYLATAKHSQSGGSIGSYALIAGGCSKLTYAHNFDAVETIDSSLTRGTAASLSELKKEMGAANTTNHLLFAGGWAYVYNSSEYGTNKVEAYNASLTKSVITALSGTTTRNSPNYMCASLDEFATFSGLKDGLINIYDGSLTKKSNLSLTTPRAGAATGTVGSYIVYAGGTDFSGSNEFNGAAISSAEALRI